jgi:hypothetical protein
MKLADKNCYPFTMPMFKGENLEPNVFYSGLTFREALILALAGNPEMFQVDGKSLDTSDGVAIVIETADAIIAEMEKENEIQT